MKTENFFTGPLSNIYSARSQSCLQRQERGLPQFDTSLLTTENLRRQQFSNGFSDKDSVRSVNSTRSKRNRLRNISMKSSKGISKKSKTMDYTTNAYNEAVSRLKLMLADSYATPKSSSTYLRNYVEDSTDNLSDNLSVIDRPVLSDISKYLSTNQRARLGSFRSKKSYSTSKENLLAPTIYQTTTPTVVPVDYYVPPKPQLSADSVQAPVEIFNFIEKQEDYIEQLEKESKYCRNELTNLLGKVKDVINENEQLTENARNELATLTGHEKHISPSSDSDDNIFASKKTSTPRKKDVGLIKSPRYASAPNIVYEARISELEAELMQANIDLKRLKNENEDLKHKVSLVDPLVIAKNVGPVNCETHRKQIEHLQMDKVALEETVRQLQKSLDEMKAQQYSATSKRHANDLMQMERAQSELEVKHLRDELDRQHERVRELQHEMSRRIADERANAERRYNSQVDQLGGDLSNQWEQVAKLQLDLERQKRYETDLKRDLAGRNAQIEELKMELRSNRSTFLADMAQVNAEKQSLEQEITSLRLQLDRAARESKTESARLNAEISSLRQRLDRGDADLLHAKREVLRLNDEIANLEKELAYGELKNEIRPTKKDLDKRMSEMQEKHVETVSELEEMIQNQKQLMDKLTNECKVLTNRLEDTSLKHNQEKQQLRDTNEKLMDRLKQIWASYKELSFKQNTHLGSNGSIKLNNDSNLIREEHFSNTAQNLVKPLSTTSRPHLAQPIPRASSATTAKPLHTITTPSSLNQQQPILTPQQLLRQLQQRHPTILMPLNPNTKLQESITESVTTSPAIAMDSTKTTMKISKTTSAKEKSNNISSNEKMKATSGKSAQLNIKPNQPMSSTPTTTSAKYKKRTQTWPLPQSVTTTMTTAATKATISNNMMQARTIQHMIRNNMMVANNHISATSNTTPAQDKHTTQILNKVVDTVTTQPPTTTLQHTNMIPQILVQQSPVNLNNNNNNSNHKQQKPTTKSGHHRRQHNQHQSHQRHRLAQEAARCLEAAQQQKAALNHERAVALWAQHLQVEQSAAENPICHNSPPRQLPKSNYVVQNAADNIELFDPFELEFSISSPSLLRSFSSETFTIISDEFDSLSEMSISPATTAIRRIPPTVNDTSGSNAQNNEQRGGEEKEDGSANVNEKVKKVAVKK